MADDPAVPPVDEPIWLYLTPAVLAMVIGVGLRLGYPVVRRDRATAIPASDGLPPTEAAAPADGLPPTEPIHGDWSGRIGGVEVARDRPLACTMTIAGVPDLPDLADVAIAERGRTQTVRIRRTAPLRIVRLVRVGGSRPGLVIHAAMADLLLSFDEPRDRDRFLEARG